MKTLNIGAYQCQCCGSVVEQELRRLPPFCCGIEMTKSSERIVSHDELLGSVPVGHRWNKTVGSWTAESQPQSRTKICHPQQA